MKKKLDVCFEGVSDPTGYLFTLVKCLSASLRCSKYHAFADDIVAASGFAFRMWIDAQLCPSATSTWEFKKQKPWVENSGLKCAYVERLWGEDAMEETRRQEALALIRDSICAGVAPVAWDVSGCEWGILCGCDDTAASLAVLKFNGEECEIPYEKLGRLEIPILSVLTVTGGEQKPKAQLVADTKALAAAHLRGEEWCEENVCGIAAYGALAGFIREGLTEDIWSLQYALGTYAALKYHAWKFFEKYGETVLSRLYHTIYTAWKAAFDLSVQPGGLGMSEKEEIIRRLGLAEEAETQALAEMES